MSANSEASYPSNAISGNNNSNSTPPEIDFDQLPAKKLLKERDLPKPKDSKPWEEVDLPVDILLLTSVNEWEFSSCVSYFNPGFFRSYHIKHGYVYFGEIGDENTTKIALIKCQKGSSGPGASTVTVRNAIPLLKPKAVICVGACGGLNESKLKLGDVVVSSKLGTYNPAKVKESGTDLRGVEVFVNRDLLYLLNTAANGWEPPLTATDERVPMVHNGEFLSGPEVVNSKRRRAQLTKKFSDALAIEMEAEGLYTVAHDLKMEWAVIKGVSDFADGRKSDTDPWRPFASVMAASVMAHILSDPTVFKDWENYESPEEKQAKRKRRETSAQASKRRKLEK